MFQIPYLSNEPLSGNPAFDTHDLKNASSGAAKVGFIFQWPFSGQAITHVGYRQGTTTGTPASNSHRVMLETLDASGNPSGTDVGSTSTTFTPVSANDNTAVWVALGSSYTPARGDFLALVIENNADTSANGITVALRYSSASESGIVLPFASSFESSVWTKTSSAFRHPAFGLQTSTSRYGVLFESIQQRTVTTSGHRVACAFTVPTSICETYKLYGVIGRLRAGTAGSTFRLGVWNAAGSLLQGGDQWDGDFKRALAGADINQHWFNGTLATLNAGTKYYVGYEHDGQTVGMGVVQLTNADDRLMLSELGTGIAYASWNGSTWTETTTDFPRVRLHIDDLTFTGGGGEFFYGSF
jgi:hypothetical protein